MKPDKPSAADFLPQQKSLKSMREAVQSCEGCDLYRFATQGETPAGFSPVILNGAFVDLSKK